MWWISFRGEGRTGVENIGVFEDDGTPRKQHPLLLDPAYPLHIARGFALVGDDLYIADAWRKDSHVARYRRQADTFQFAECVVTSGSGSVMAEIPADLPTGRLKARTVVDGKLNAPSGVAIGPDGDLYVAERKKRRVRQFSAEGKLRGTFIEDLPDMPEFLAYVPDGAAPTGAG